jgi:DNA-binding CsgD family transcriptional regulator
VVVAHVFRPSGPGGIRLLEREEELVSLERAVQAAAAGAGVVALVEGQAGIGKSRLLGEARAFALREGLAVFSARGSELEHEYPFGVVRQLFEVVVVGEQGGVLLSGPAATASVVFGHDVGHEAGAGAVPFSTLHALYWLTVNAAAQQPVMLLVDDAHWCDLPSLRFIAYLVRRLEALPVLVALGVRPGEAPLLEEIALDPLTVSIRPKPLSAPSVRELVGAALGEQPGGAFVAACQRASGGNPMLLAELLRALAAERVTPDDAQVEAIGEVGPVAVSRIVLIRLRRLPSEAVSVARALAVLGASASAATVAALTGLSQPVVAGAVAELIGADIVGPEPPLGFIHPLVRDAIYRDLSPAERERDHEAAAGLLRDARASAEEVGAQLLRVHAAGRSWIADALREAAREATARGALESTVTYRRRAVQERAAADERELLLELGIAEAAVDAPAAAISLRAARELTGDPLARAQIGELRTRMLIFTDPREALTTAREAAVDAPAEAVDLRLALQALEAYAAEFTTRDARVLARLEHSRMGVVGDGPGASMLRAVVAWDWALNGGTAEECGALASAAVSDTALGSGSGRLLTPTPLFTRYVSAAVLVLADSERAAEILDELVMQAQRHGAPHPLIGANVWRGCMWARRGELSEAEACLRDAIEAMKVWSVGGGGVPLAFGLLADVLIERGDLAAARQALADRGPVGLGGEGDALCRYAELKLLAAEHRFEEALEAADAYCEQFGRVVNPGWTGWRSVRAQALSSLGRLEEALDQLAQELALARHWGTAGAVGQALAQLGALQGDDGLGLLHEAVELTADSPARLEHAKALAALGGALRRARRPSDARRPLRLAHELATRCGAKQLADHARAELEATGARPRNLAFRGPGSLTPSERRVADLAAAGETNRAIAQQLYLSPKTVQVHLSSVYRKLEINARGALAAALGAGAAD